MRLDQTAIVLGARARRLCSMPIFANQGVRIALQGHAPFARRLTLAVYETLKHCARARPPKVFDSPSCPNCGPAVTRDEEMKVPRAISSPASENR